VIAALHITHVNNGQRFHCIQRDTVSDIQLQHQVHRNWQHTFWVP